MPERRLLTIQEAAEYLGFSVHTLYGWTSQRKIPFLKIGGACGSIKKSSKSG